MCADANIDQVAQKQYPWHFCPPVRLKMSLNWHGVNKFHWNHHTHAYGALTITGTQADRTGSSTKVSRSFEKRKVRCEKHAALGQECKQDPRCGCPCQWHRPPMWRMDNGLARLCGKYHKRYLKLPPPSSILLDLFYVKVWPCHFKAILVRIEHCQIKWPTAIIHMLRFFYDFKV